MCEGLFGAMGWRLCTGPRVVHSGDEGPWDVHGVTKFVTRVTLRVRGGGLLAHGAGIERKPLQENGSPGGRRRRKIPARGTCRETQSRGGPGFSRQRSNVGGRDAVETRPSGRCRCQGVCDRRAQDGPVVARAADNGVDGRLGTALWCRLWGQEKKQVKTVGCSILPPPPHHPLTKNVTPAGTLPINCQWRTGGPGAGTGTKSPGAKRSVGRTTGYKVSSNWHASCLKGGTA